MVLTTGKLASQVGGGLGEGTQELGAVGAIPAGSDARPGHQDTYVAVLQSFMRDNVIANLSQKGECVTASDMPGRCLAGCCSINDSWCISCLGIYVLTRQPTAYAKRPKHRHGTRCVHSPLHALGATRGPHGLLCGLLQGHSRRDM